MPTNPPRPDQPTAHHHTRPVLALLVLGACLTLAACGSSSGTSGSSSASSKSGTTASNAGGGGSNRSTALRECLQKQGVTLPSAPSGGSTPSGSSPPTGTPGSGFKLPKGESAAQLQAALKKCGGGNFPAAGAARFGGARSSKAFAKFTTCMRENGVNLPAANTSGKGPVFNTKGINTSSTAFKSAESKCRSDLGAAPGGGGSPSGGPPTGGGSPTSGEAPAGGAPPAGENG
jgi:hypothetical protein